MPMTYCSWDMFKGCTRFVHAKGTSKQDTKTDNNDDPRAAFHNSCADDDCAHCGKSGFKFGPKKPDDGKAAHVVAYPCGCFNCCCGCLTFKKTCTNCNSQKRMDPDTKSQTNKSIGFWGCWNPCTKYSNLSCVCCKCSCCQAEMKDRDGKCSNQEGENGLLCNCCKKLPCFS